MVLSKHCLFLLTLIGFLFFSSCTLTNYPSIQIQANPDQLWSYTDNYAIYQSQTIGNHLLVSTDRGLIDLRVDFDDPYAQWLIRSKDLILNHSIAKTTENDRKRYFYLERSSLRFFDIEASPLELQVKKQSLGSVSTKKYGTFLDGINPSRHVFSPAGDTLYIARYGNIYAFKPGQNPLDAFHIPNFASHIIADNQYVYYRAFERERPSSHLFAAVDTKKDHEVWRKLYGPDHQQWYDIVDSFPVLSTDEQLYFIVRAYPITNYDQEGLFILEHIEKESGKVLDHFELITPHSIGQSIPLGPIRITDKHLVGEVYAPARLSKLDLSDGKELWTKSLEHPLLDLIYDIYRDEWVALLENGGVTTFDPTSGQIIRTINPPEFDAHTFSYGQIHVTEEGYYLGHLNNREAYTYPRALFFAYR